MPVLLLTSDNADIENEIARKTAERLGYQTLDRTFLDQVAGKYDLDRKKLADALKITPSILRRMPAKTWNYMLSCVEVEVLARLSEDALVCWGLAAHLYVTVVSHVLKVKLIGDGKGGKGPDPVRKKRIGDASDRKDRWSLAAFNRKQSDSDLYDMVLNLDQVLVEEAVDTLVTTLGYPRFKAMTYSQNAMADMVLAARVKNSLLKTLSDIRVNSDNGTVVVTTSSVKREKNKKIEAIKRIAGDIDGIGYIEVHWNKDILAEASASFR